MLNFINNLINAIKKGIIAISKSHKRGVSGMADIFSVASYILDKKGPMTTMKLQKLCYYSQAWNLVWNKKPLFDEDFQAWTNGPVCRELYDRHKGKYMIQPGDIPAVERELTVKEKKTIDSILNYYGDKDPEWLSTLTHMEKPWNEARVGFADGQNCENIITKESMIRYYGSL